MAKNGFLLHSPMRWTPLIHPSIHPSIRPSVRPSVRTSIHLSIHPLIHLHYSILTLQSWFDATGKQPLKHILMIAPGAINYRVLSPLALNSIALNTNRSNSDPILWSDMDLILSSALAGRLLNAKKIALFMQSMTTYILLNNHIVLHSAIQESLFLPICIVTVIRLL